MNERKRIPIEHLVEGQVYRVHGRNLHFGVFVAPDYFIGIRLKFTSMFLDAEGLSPEESGMPCLAKEALEGVVVPDHIELLSRGRGSYDEETKREVAFDSPVADGGRGWYFVDTDEPNQDIKPRGRNNHALYYFLMGVEAAHNPNFAARAAFCAGEFLRFPPPVDG